jgi:hypothetical protein
MNAAGLAIVGWQDHRGASFYGWVRPPNGGFGSRETIVDWMTTTAPNAVAQGLRLAVTPTNRVLALWDRRLSDLPASAQPPSGTGSQYSLRATDGSWGNPADIAVYPGGTQLALDGAGNTRFVTDGTYFGGALQTAMLPADASTLQPAHVELPGSLGYAPQIVRGDGAGDLLAVLEHDALGPPRTPGGLLSYQQTYALSEQTVGGSFTTPLVFGDSATPKPPGAEPQIDMNAAGGAIVVYNDAAGNLLAQLRGLPLPPTGIATTTKHQEPAATGVLRRLAMKVNASQRQLIVRATCGEPCTAVIQATMRAGKRIITLARPVGRYIAPGHKLRINLRLTSRPPSRAHIRVTLTAYNTLGQARRISHATRLL